MIVKVIIILFVLFVFSKLVARFKAGDITRQEFAIWLVFWTLVIAVTLMPKKTDVLAKLLGVGRGADLLIYISIIVLFFIVFKILVQLEKIDKNITRIVRSSALANKESNINNSNQKQDMSDKHSIEK
jgi:hypothetical protein